MSASPSAPSAGTTPNGATAGPKVIIRTVKADPLVRRKPNYARKPLPNAPAGSSLNKVNGLSAPKPNLKSKPQRPSVPPQDAAKNSSTNASGLPGSNTKPTPPKDPRGFSEAPKSAENTYYWPLYTTKRDLIQGLRHHVAKFASKKIVDPTDEQTFTRPVRLHRRDPRAPPSGAGGNIKDDPTAMDSKENLLDDKERERQEILQQEREAQRQADLAQIAPTAKLGRIGKKAASKKKIQQVYRAKDDPEAEKASKLRYEESMPWHLEDFDNKNIWVGNYESALSDIHVGLTVGSSCFYMIPVEKWYKFTPKNQFTTLTIEEAESRMKAKVKEPRWFMESRMANQVKREEDENKKRVNKLFIGKWEDNPGGRASITAHKSEFADVDDLDFEEDRFADDEEPTILEGEAEEARQAEDRIKRDQLKANVFDLKEEQEYDKEAEEEQKENELEKRLGKSVRKALMKREKNYIYDDDTDENPYSEGSESDDSDEERRKEEERKKAEEKEKADKQNTKDKDKDKEGNKTPSGISTKGTNTPSGKNKHLDPLKKATANNLKRPGSPDLSEASGTEAARKKPKKKHASSQPTATSTPAPASRASSPAPPTSVPDGNSTRATPVPRSSLSVESNKANDTQAASANTSKKRARAAGSGSDGDATGGEMSDNARYNNAKRSRPSPKAGSPRGSRAGSPNPPTARQGSVGAAAGSNNINTNSRAASPSTTARSPVQTDVSLPPPSEAEIIASIPPEGTTTKELLEKFKHRVPNTIKAAFINLVKKHSYLDKNTKKLLPRPTSTGVGSAAGGNTPTAS